MSFFDRFKKKQVVEPAPEVPEVIEKVVKVPSSDADVLKAILRELAFSNDLAVWRLNPDDPKRAALKKVRGGE